MNQAAREAPEQFPLHALPHQSRQWEVDAPLTPILGRDGEIGEIERRLDRGDVRLVTLTGAGGIGKTRLARAVALHMQGEFAHGACFVSFAALRDPELVASAAAQALGLQLMTDRPADELVIDALHDRHVLLVLDNLEHLVNTAAPWLSHLLQRCPRLSALVTSRLPLRIAGEHRFAVEPLPVPDRGIEADCDGDEESAAVELFVQRASAVVPEFQLTRTNAEIVASICRSVDGLPLAIELAAVQIRLLSPRQLIERMSNHLTELRTDQRDASPRHQTMRDAIAWSYDLLDPDGKRLFRRLSVFVGGFSLDGVMAMGGLGEPDVRAPLLELVEHSLVTRRDGGPDGYRFDMLEVVREFGLSQLEARHESGEARDQHAAWYLRLARDAEPRMSRPEQVEWLERLELEHDNIRHAVAWFNAKERIDEAMDLTGSLWFFRLIRGYYTEARDQFEYLLGHPEGRFRTLARGKALNGLGIIASHQGDFERSRQALREAIEIFEEQADQRWRAIALLCYGTAYAFIGRLDEAETHIEESRVIAEMIGDEMVLSAAICNLGAIAYSRGDRKQARELWEASAKAAESTGDRWGLSLAQGNLAQLDFADGKIDSAERQFRSSARLIEELGDRRDLPGVYCSIAHLARQRGNLAEARSMFEESLAVARSMGDWLHLTWSKLGLGQVALLEGDGAVALGLVREAMQSFEGNGDHLGAILCLDSVADIAAAHGDAWQAAWCIGAVDGMLARFNRARVQDTLNEHQTRIETITAKLGKTEWEAAWAEGNALDTAAVLAESYAWQLPDAATAPAGHHAPPERVEQLSPRELEVLKLMADGLTNQEVADRLFVSQRTATSHASNILGKLGLSTRTAAVAYAIRSGLA